MPFGAMFAIDEINAGGGIKSMGGVKLEPLLGDNQAKPEVGVSVVEKMNEEGVSAFVGCNCCHVRHHVELCWADQRNANPWFKAQARTNTRVLYGCNYVVPVVRIYEVEKYQLIV